MMKRMNVHSDKIIARFFSLSSQNKKTLRLSAKKHNKRGGYSSDKSVDISQWVCYNIINRTYVRHTKQGNALRHKCTKNKK